MSTESLLHQIRAAGLRVELKSSGKLYLAPANRLTSELRERIEQRRSDLVAALQSSRRVVSVAEAEAAELSRLVRLCCDAYQFTESEQTEALQVAHADPVSALICFRAIARKLFKGDARARTD